MSRISFCLLTGVVFLVMAAAACAPRVAPAPPAATPTPAAADEWQKVVEAAKKEGQLNPYSFFLTGEPAKAIAQAFEAKYGIKVEMITGVGTVLIERIQGEHAGGKYLADTVDSALSLVATAKTRGLTQSWGNLPSFAETGVWVAHPKTDAEGHIISGGVTHVTPYINTTLVKAGEEPKVVKGLLDPKWGGQKIVVGSPITDPLVIYWYVAKLIDDDFLRKLAQNNPRLVPTVRDSVAGLARGESAIAFLQADTVAGDLIARGSPLKAIELAEGLVRTPSLSMAMVKNAPHPNAARLFANWILSAEGQTVWHKARSTAPARTDVPSFLPPGANLKYKKVISQGLSEMLEVSRLQREGTVAKLLGIEK